MPAPPPPNVEGAARDPGQEEGHLEPSERGPPLLHVARPRPLPRGRGADLVAAVKRHKLLGLLLLPRAGRPPRTPPHGLAARSGRRGGGLLRPADGPPRELRRHRGATSGGWRSSSSCGSRPCGRTGWSTTTSSSSAPRAARARAASPAQRPLQPDPQLPGAGQQAGADPGTARSTSARGAWPALSRDSRAHLESAAARAREREEPAALQGQGLRRARSPDVLRGPRGLQHARPDGPHSAAAASAPDRRGLFLLRRCGYCRPRSSRATTATSASESSASRARSACR